MKYSYYANLETYEANPFCGSIKYHGKSPCMEKLPPCKECRSPRKDLETYEVNPFHGWIKHHGGSL